MSLRSTTTISRNEPCPDSTQPCRSDFSTPTGLKVSVPFTLFLASLLLLASACHRSTPSDNTQRTALPQTIKQAALAALDARCESGRFTNTYSEGSSTMTQWRAAEPHNKCLDWTLVGGRRHLERVLRVYTGHYNRGRPHRSLDLAPPEDDHSVPSLHGSTVKLKRHDLLGGPSTSTRPSSDGSEYWHPAG